MILRESIFRCLLFATLSQNSSLWARLFIIPLRVLIVFLSKYYQLSIILYLYTIVFIRGLLIFLITVASLIIQDQRYSIAYSFGLLSILLLMYPVFINSNWESETQIRLPLWLVWNSSFILFILLFLTVSLSIIRHFFLNFKGLIRIL